MPTPTRLMHLLRGSALLLALMVSSPGWSEEAWTLERIVQKTVIHPAVLAKTATADAAKADVDGAEWQRFPTPSLEGGRDTHGNYASVVRIDQPLWAGGRITSGIEAAESRHGAAIKGVDEARQELIIRAINAYVEAYRQQTRQDVLVKQVRRHEHLLEMISRRVGSEASATIDRELAQSRLHLALGELSQGKQALNVALIQLSELTGEKVTKVTQPRIQASNLATSIDNLLSEAMTASPTLSRIGMEQNAAAADVDSKKSVLWPQLVARYENTSGPLSESRGLLVASSQVGAGLSAISGVDSAKSKQEAVKMQRDSALRDLRVSVMSDWDELAAAKIRLRHAQLSQSGTSEVFDSYTRQYTIGRKSWLDVMNAVREDTQAELVVADANAQVNASTMRLQERTNRLKLDAR